MADLLATRAEMYSFHTSVRTLGHGPRGQETGQKAKLAAEIPPTTIVAYVYSIMTVTATLVVKIRGVGSVIMS